jgi:hypothetical protein
VERNLLVQAAITVFDAEILDVLDPPEPADSPATTADPSLTTDP